MSFPTLDETRAAFETLSRDLIHDDGPRISTMRNYRFAIVLYDPANEFEIRTFAQRLETELGGKGWRVRPISLQKLFIERVRAQGPDWTHRVTAMERRMATIEASRGVNYLQSKLAPLIEGPDGLAADCSRVIHETVERHPEAIDRTLALIGRAGALYPFFRSSALLRHLDGHTRNVPVVILYPGERRGKTGISFMGVLQSDADYRPRIYA